jgi:hypothetical protein
MIEPRKIFLVVAIAIATLQSNYTIYCTSRMPCVVVDNYWLGSDLSGRYSQRLVWYHDQSEMAERNKLAHASLLLNVPYYHQSR